MRKHITSNISFYIYNIRIFYPLLLWFLTGKMQYKIVVESNMYVVLSSMPAKKEKFRLSNGTVNSYK